MKPVTDVPVEAYLVVAVLLFGLGLFTALRRTNAIMILMGIELMLNAVNLNLVAFSRYLPAGLVDGQVFAVFVITLAAAEAAIGLGIVLMLARKRQSVDVSDFTELKG
ncbi:MAG: NADH-quinone oxidoreductase subunit NuoK [Bacillota bacterium]|nr:NADH-quinone oxidoreductase subunit NuoK [Bacillota bacterium]